MFSRVIGHQQRIIDLPREVFRQEGHFAAAAQKIDGKMGNAEAGSMSLQSPYDI